MCLWAERTKLACSGCGTLETGCIATSFKSNILCQAASEHTRSYHIGAEREDAGRLWEAAAGRPLTYLVKVTSR